MGVESRSVTLILKGDILSIPTNSGGCCESYVGLRSLLRRSLATFPSDCIVFVPPVVSSTKGSNTASLGATVVTHEDEDSVNGLGDVVLGKVSSGLDGVAVGEVFGSLEEVPRPPSPFGLTGGEVLRTQLFVVEDSITAVSFRTLSGVISILVLEGGGGLMERIAGGNI